MESTTQLDDQIFGASVQENKFEADYEKDASPPKYASE